MQLKLKQKGVCSNWPALLWSNSTSSCLVYQALAGYLASIGPCPCSIYGSVLVVWSTRHPGWMNFIEGRFFNWWQGCCELGKAEAVQALLHHGRLLRLLHKVDHQLWVHQTKDNCCSGSLCTCSKSLCPSNMNGWTLCLKRFVCYLFPSKMHQNLACHF